MKTIHALLIGFVTGLASLFTVQNGGSIATAIVANQVMIVTTAAIVGALVAIGNLVVSIVKKK